jgi:CheY-like chemotaxis protein
VLVNAVKYSSFGQTIAVTVTADESSAFVKIVDHGRGIDEADLARVFEPFEQTGAVASGPGGGLGLGLPIARGLVEAHGGELVLESEGQGRGTCACIRLPRGHSAPVRANHSSPASSRSPLRILVVDDHEDAADALRELLTLYGHEVVIAHDGATALREARSPLDLILCDLGLPDMDGCQVAKSVRANTFDPYLVALTGYADEASRMRARQAGFDEYITKPIETDELAAILAQAAST